MSRDDFIKKIDKVQDGIFEFMKEKSKQDIDYSDLRVICAAMGSTLLHLFTIAPLDDETKEKEFARFLEAFMNAAASEKWSKQLREDFKKGKFKDLH